MIIYRPPENTTACRGDNATISCGYVSGTVLPITWIINGTSVENSTIVNSSLYQLNIINPSYPILYSLIVFSINGTSTFQCIVHSTPNTTTSTLGTVTVIGTYVHAW